jgi:plastocyanin
MKDNSQPFSVSSDSADNVAAFDSRTMETGDTFTYTFQESGTFAYYCAVHPNMAVKVVVS